MAIPHANCCIFLQVFLLISALATVISNRIGIWAQLFNLIYWKFYLQKKYISESTRLPDSSYADAPAHWDHGDSVRLVAPSRSNTMAIKTQNNKIYTNNPSLTRFTVANAERRQQTSNI